MQSLMIKNLHVEVEGKEILKGINLTINQGETLAILGPNGHGKSTLFNAIMGHPKYHITKGSIYLNGEDITNSSTNERSIKGLFLAMQNPSEVPGVVNAEFLRSAINARNDKPVSLYNFYKMLDNACKILNMPFELANRNLNEGFSGGEKKRNEILQMILLNPTFCMLDEIDSGLDVDAINDVSNAINQLQDNNHAFLVISHYARLFNLINPTHACIMVNGQIVLHGDASLINKVDKEGYEFLKTEHGIDIEKHDDKKMNSVSIGVCATKELTKNVHK